MTQCGLFNGVPAKFSNSLEQANCLGVYVQGYRLIATCTRKA